MHCNEFSNKTYRYILNRHSSQEIFTYTIIYMMCSLLSQCHFILIYEYCSLGGLGDVAGSLPKALARRGHRVMVTLH